ncbi:MAG: MarP family serine protease [Candidatus Saccharimonadales bacterium]
MAISFVDIGVVSLLIVAALRGFQIGLLRQVFSTIGFLLGLYPGVLLSSFIMSHLSDTSRSLVGLVVVLAICLFCMSAGERLALRLKIAIRTRAVHMIDSVGGSVMSMLTLLVGLWLAASLFSLAPPSGFQAQLKNSAILSSILRKLPPIGSSLSTLAKFIDPSQSPQVFIGREPSPDANRTLPNPHDFAVMLSRVQPSVVKIEGLGCGGIVDGSGFVYAKEFVATNAHVIAGVGSPKVRSGSVTYNTTVQLFDPENDLAALRVPGLPAPALALHTAPLQPDAPVFALGYPGGGSLATNPAVVLETFHALGQDIYGVNRTNREVYSLQTTVVRGNSGGPIVTPDGTVAGVVFATSTTYNNVGYALTVRQITSSLMSANHQTQAVPTGECSQ